MSGYGHGGNKEASSHDDEGFELPDGFKMPDPTYAFGEIGPIDPVPDQGPSQVEIEDRRLVDEALALATKDIWADDPPSLHARIANKK